MTHTQSHWCVHQDKRRNQVCGCRRVRAETIVMWLHQMKKKIVTLLQSHHFIHTRLWSVHRITSDSRVNRPISVPLPSRLSVILNCRSSSRLLSSPCSWIEWFAYHHHHRCRHEGEIVRWVGLGKNGRIMDGIIILCIIQSVQGDRICTRICNRLLSIRLISIPIIEYSI